MGFWIGEPCGCEGLYSFLKTGPETEYQAPKGQHIMILLKVDPEVDPKFPAVKQASVLLAEFQDCPSYKPTEEVN